MIILETCGLTEGRAGRIDREIKSNPLVLDFVDPKDPFGSARLYQDLAGMSFGDVPTLLEFLAMIPADRRAWVDGCITLNPDTFQWIFDIAQEVMAEDLEALKKLLGPQAGPSVIETAGPGKKKPKPTRSKKRIK